MCVSIERFVICQLWLTFTDNEMFRPCDDKRVSDVFICVYWSATIFMKSLGVDENIISASDQS